MKIKFFVDTLIIMIGSLIVNFVLQLIILPFIAGKNSTTDFGQILLIIAIINSASMLIGGSLNNIKLINEGKKYNTGNYLAILLLTFLISVPFLFILIRLFSPQETTIPIILLVLLMVVRTYSIVYYRLSLSFVKMTIQSTILALGYVIGIFILNRESDWVYILLLGEILSMLYILPTLVVFKKDFTLNNNFINLFKDYFTFLFSNIVNVISMYVDRYFIMFLLSAEFVGIFFIASIVGKLLSTITVPLSSVVLSYLTKYNVNDRKKLFNKVTIGILGICFLIFICTILVSPFIINIFYSGKFDSVKNYYNVANLGALIFLAGTFLNTFTLKFIEIKFQVLIQYSYLILYLFICFIMTKLLGFEGFLYGVVIANCIRLLLISYFTNKYLV